MKINTTDFTYCTNIYAGESWADHFSALKGDFPTIKNDLSPEAPMGIGLRLSNIASIAILEAENLQLFKQWLHDNDAYVFTMNGFPYGGFHDTIVKDQVHAPDWTTENRLAYTLRLFNILAGLLPPGMEGGISTSPLSYRYWFNEAEEISEAKKVATQNILKVAEELYLMKLTKGVTMHLDIEPEPDGILETGSEFIAWFETVLLPAGILYFQNQFELNATEAEEVIKEHIRLCYDVCHFAIGYESHEEVINILAQKGIKVGKIQLSAALKGSFDAEGRNKQDILTAFSYFNEPTYLHQVVARNSDGSLVRYPDLPAALAAQDYAEEWRAHFHVPVFLESFGVLQSTQDDIVKVLELQAQKNFTQHLEVETYTWGVLPGELKLPLTQSIIRELNWVKHILSH
ncbi:metabolite traffic protein EboE [Mucilaginibacter sp. FT3.2]|uniref:metabolite traffic protein EboE n=1 Tax=Mucilaginibacter sp. FT3.2 TaxID=2723090 RepID=UPI00160C8FC1|nr:metabolite traffic protein EboE [Mucilaginibacter sp. FT3.2]MBB6232898.1 hypothetical protein [Mucilaginibacter sp. FT3.2]